MFIDFERGRGSERERERDRQIDRQTYQSVAFCMSPNWGLNPQPFSVYGMMFLPTEPPDHGLLF